MMSEVVIKRADGPATGNELAGFTRRYDIDALRVIAFCLLILYHCGMFYVADWGWHVKSAHQSEFLQVLMLLTNQWRMALLFMISGMAAAFMLRRLSVGHFAWSRLKRLLLPLVFGMLVIVVPQAYFQGTANGAFEYSYIEFYGRYLALQPWPEGAFDGWDFGWTWNHLWYLPYVLAYSLVLALIYPLLRSVPGQHLLSYLRSLGAWSLFVVPVILLMTIMLMLRRDHPQTHNFHADWYLHAVYFSVFVLGFIISLGHKLWSHLQNYRWHTLAIAFCCYGLLIWGRNGLPDELSEAWYWLVYGVLALNSWMWLCTVLGWGHHLLNRPLSWLPYTTEAVYPWYILHQSITVIAGFYLARWEWLQSHWAPVLEPILLVGITIAGCVLIHEFLIRRVKLLRPLFGLPMQSKLPQRRQQQREDSAKQPSAALVY